MNECKHICLALAVWEAWSWLSWRSLWRNKGRRDKSNDTLDAGSIVFFKKILKIL
jgi:hypothetical protein